MYFDTLRETPSTLFDNFISYDADERTEMLENCLVAVI